VSEQLKPGEFRLGHGTAGSIAGKGPPIVLLHGVGLDRRMWQAQVYYFARSHTVVCYDLLGHGQSAKISAPCSLAHFTRQLEDVLTALKLDKVSLIGFSFGGMIAQSFAIRYSDALEKLVLMSSVYARSAVERAAVEARLREAREQGPQAIYPTALERWFSPAFLAGQPEQAQELHHRMLDNDEASFLAAYEIFASADRQLEGQLNHIACPTLVMTGEEDKGSTPTMAWKMANEIPDAKVTIIAGGRHMMPAELAQEVNREIDRFLRASQARWRNSNF
jgi:(E)-2-((N-methylformamido)methylene)succinate hydrolase